MSCSLLNHSVMQPDEPQQPGSLPFPVISRYPLFIQVLIIKLQSCLAILAIVRPKVGEGCLWLLHLHSAAHNCRDTCIRTLGNSTHAHTHTHTHTHTHAHTHAHTHTHTHTTHTHNHTQFHIRIGTPPHNTHHMHTCSTHVLYMYKSMFVCTYVLILMFECTHVHVKVRTSTSLGWRTYEY